MIIAIAQPIVSIVIILSVQTMEINIINVKLVATVIAIVQRSNPALLIVIRTHQLIIVQMEA